MTIIWSPKALDDFDAIVSRRAQFSIEAGTRLSLAIADRLELLDEHPGQGRMIPELGHEQFREVLVRGYRICYRVRGTDAELIGILHGSVTPAANPPPPAPG